MQTTLFLITISFVAFANAKFVLKPEESKALEKFRPLVKDLITHEYQTIDSYLIRWVRARKLNVNDAVKMFRDSQKWRADNKIDALQNEDFPEFPESKYRFTSDGVDNEGRPVFATSLGDFDIRRIVIAGQQDIYRRYNWKLLDRAVAKGAEAVYRSNGTLDDSRLVSIIDMKGFSLRKHACLTCVDLYIRNTRNNELNYPGVAARSIIINTPRAANSLFQLILPFASEESIAATKIFGSNRTEWSEYLRTIIPADQLTYQFGGSKMRN